MRISTAILAIGLSASALAAQVAAGKSVATSVDVASPSGTSSMWVVDHQSRSAIKLTISAALAAERCNCVLMANTAIGYVGTNPLPPNTPGNVYRITVTNSTVTETKLNTGPTAGGNVGQLGVVGTDLWFTTQDASGAGGILQKVPLAGGAVTKVLDLSLLTGYNGLANALCVVGTKVYVGTFDSGNLAATPGCIVVYDTATSTGSVLRQLPQGKFIGGSTPFNTALVAMQNVGGSIHCLGVYGDYLVFNTAGTLVSHDFSGFTADGWTTANLSNSFDFDPNTGDAIVGSRDGACDRLASGQSAEWVVTGIGTNPTTANNSLTGLAHLAATSTTAATDVSYGGSGCAGVDGYKLTDAASGLPSAGNAAYRVGVYSGTGGDTVACLIASAQQAPPINLTSVGMDGCLLSVSSTIVAIVGKLAGTGNGVGTITFGLPIPASAVGVTLYRQWAEIQATKTNPLGVVVSNARKMTVR